MRISVLGFALKTTKSPNMRVKHSNHFTKNLYSLSNMEKDNQLVAQQNTPVVFNFFDAAQFETMQRVCRTFANSDLVPDMYKTSDKNPEAKAIANCMIAIEMAQRIGASPLMIMQNMVIIYGRPSWSSKFLVATVNTCGRFNPLQYRFTEKGMLGKVDYTEYEKVWDKTLWNGKGDTKQCQNGNF
jgi:hypothetical protein